MIDHAYIFATIFFTVYSQLIMRWQVSQAGALPSDTVEKIYYIWHLLLNPWILTSIVATFLAGVSWMLAMTRFEISYAYPWISLNFVLMLAFGFFLLGETFTLSKLFGVILIVSGVIIIGRA